MEPPARPDAATFIPRRWLLTTGELCVTSISVCKQPPKAMPGHAPVYSAAAGSLGASLPDFGPDLAFGVFLAFLAGGSAAAASSSDTSAGASAATGSSSAAGSSAAGGSATACKGRGGYRLER